MSSGLRPFSKDLKKRKELLYNQQSSSRVNANPGKPLTKSLLESSKPLIELANKNKPFSKTVPGKSPNVQKTDAPKPAASPKDTRQFTEYMLFSSKIERTNNILRFQSSHEINPKTFVQPIKLRRKERYSYNPYGNLDQNNKSNNTEGSDGKNLNAETFEIKESGNDNEKPANEPGSSTISKADQSIIAPFGGGVRNKQMMFKKKTKQIFFADEQQRRLNIEESRPWILEDFDAKQNWTGTLEGGQKSNYVLFVLMNEGFKVVPVDRWYKFSSKINYPTLSIDEAEVELKRSKKGDTHDRWLMKKRAKQLEASPSDKPSTEMSAKDKIVSILEAVGDTEPDQKTDLVEYEDDTNLDENDDGVKRRRSRQNINGGADEIDFEDHFEDDEEMAEDLMEGMEDDADKDKSQSKNNALGRSDDEHDDEEETDKLGDVGKEMKDLMRKLEKNKAYESENEDNPYISDLSDQSDDEEEVKTNEAENATNVTENNQIPAEGGDYSTRNALLPAIKSEDVSAIQKAKNADLLQKKRKRQEINEEENAKRNAISSSHPRLHQQESASSGPRKNDSSTNSGQASESSSLITEEEIVDLIQTNQLTTKDLISKVKRKLKENPLNKQRISDIVKRIATQRNGILVLKNSK